MSLDIWMGEPLPRAQVPVPREQRVREGSLSFKDRLRREAKRIRRGRARRHKKRLRRKRRSS
jgi:hypothetical protein